MSARGSRRVGCRAGVALIALVTLFGWSGCGRHDNPTTASGTDNALLVQLNARFNDGRTVRWENLPIPAFTRGIARPEEITVWTAATGGAVTFAFVNSPPAAGISIRFGGGTDVCGSATVEFTTDGRITSVDIQVVEAIFRTPVCVNTVSHEVGHAIGFLAHTADRGLMDPDGGNGEITPADAAFVRSLYALAPGTFVGLGERARAPAGRTGKRSMTFVDPVRR
jgi:hypothetical protein